MLTEFQVNGFARIGRAICVVLLSTIVVGCQLPTHRNQRVELPAPGIVDVGGDVGVPQSLEIPGQGLTLRGALAQAGGPDHELIAEYDAENNEQPLVAIQRSLGPIQQTTYFPLKLVERGRAGEAQLSDGDVVQIVNSGTTSLDPAVMEEAGYQIDFGREFAVLGRVPASGTYKIATNFNGSQLFSIRHLSEHPDIGRPEERKSDEIITLARTSPNRIGKELFVMPMDFAGSFNTSIAAGDVYTFTRVERVPVVLASIVAPIVRQRIETAMESLAARRPPRPGERLHASVRDNLQTVNQSVVEFNQGMYTGYRGLFGYTIDNTLHNLGDRLSEALQILHPPTSN